MALTPPTLEAFLTRFPEFDGQGLDDTIEANLTDAADQIDTTWRTEDQQIAMMLLAAHWTAGGQEQASGGGGAGAIRSESFGPISVSYSEGAATAAAGQYAGTAYGVRFANLQQKNFPGIVAIGPCGPLVF